MRSRLYDQQAPVVLLAVLSCLAAGSFTVQPEATLLGEEDLDLDSVFDDLSSYNPDAPTGLDQVMADAMTGKNLLKGNASTPEEERQMKINEEALLHSVRLKHIGVHPTHNESQKAASVIVDSDKTWGARANMTAEQTANEAAVSNGAQAAEPSGHRNRDIDCVNCDVHNTAGDVDAALRHAFKNDKPSAAAAATETNSSRAATGQTNGETSIQPEELVASQ